MQIPETLMRVGDPGLQRRLDSEYNKCGEKERASWIRLLQSLQKREWGVSGLVC